MKLQILPWVGVFAALCNGQSQTVVDLNGNTVVEVVTVNAALGVPSTSIIETLGVPNAAATSPTNTATTPVLQVPATSTTTPPAAAVQTTTTTPVAQQPAVQQGPVGQPAPTPTGPVITTYVYTTTDAAGDTESFTATFVPTFPATQAPPAFTTTGTILGFSQWLSLVGTNTVPVSSAGMPTYQVPRGAWGVFAALISGSLTGAWLVFA